MTGQFQWGCLIGGGGGLLQTFINWGEIRTDAKNMPSGNMGLSNWGGKLIPTLHFDIILPYHYTTLNISHNVQLHIQIYIFIHIYHVLYIHIIEIHACLTCLDHTQTLDVQGAL